MEDRGIKSLGDFEWASAAKYIVYISTITGLGEISSERVNSFSLSRLGPDKLLKQKEGVLRLLEGNKAKLCRFVEAYKDILDKHELAVLRSMYMQYVSNVETVQRHIDFIGVCVVELEMVRIKLWEDREDDLF